MRKVVLFTVLFLVALTTAAQATSEKIDPFKGTWDVTLNDSSKVTWEILDNAYVSSSGASHVGYGISNPGNVEFVLYWSKYMQDPAKPLGSVDYKRYAYIEKPHADVVDYNSLPQELTDYTFITPTDDAGSAPCFAGFALETAGPYPLQSGARTSVCTMAPDNGTDNDTGFCPAQKVLGADNPKLSQLRDFRDSLLAQSAIGKKIIAIYYNNAAAVNAALDRSPALQTMARKVFEAAALLK